MSTTPNLGLPHIHANQGQKEVTANQFADGLDIAIAGSVIISLDGKINYALTTQEASYAILVFTGVLTAAATITVPTDNANKKWIVAHQCKGNFPIKIQLINMSQSITIYPNERRWLYSTNDMLSTLQTAPRLKTMPFANPLRLDWSDADRIFVELTGDTTLEHTNALPGQTVTLILKQDEKGNHQITWRENVRLSDAIPNLTLTTTPKKHDKISFVFNDDGTNHYDAVFLARNF